MKIKPPTQLKDGKEEPQTQDDGILKRPAFVSIFGGIIIGIASRVMLVMDAEKYPELAEAGRTGVTHSLNQWAMSLPWAYPNATTVITAVGSAVAIAIAIAVKKDQKKSAEIQGKGG